MSGLACPAQTPYSPNQSNFQEQLSYKTDKAWMQKVPMKNWDLGRLFKGYCCPVHWKEDHPLWECNYLLRFFDIEEKPGVILLPAWKCSKCAPLANH
eukprot:204515-Ditylum_brightwellii.AAC.1